MVEIQNVVSQPVMPQIGMPAAEKRSETGQFDFMSYLLGLQTAPNNNSSQVDFTNNVDIGGTADSEDQLLELFDQKMNNQQSLMLGLPLVGVGSANDAANAISALQLSAGSEQKTAALMARELGCRPLWDSPRSLDGNQSMPLTQTGNLWRLQQGMSAAEPGKKSASDELELSESEAALLKVEMSERSGAAQKYSSILKVMSSNDMKSAAVASSRSNSMSQAFESALPAGQDGASSGDSLSAGGNASGAHSLIAGSEHSRMMSGQTGAVLEGANFLSSGTVEKTDPKETVIEAMCPTAVSDLMSKVESMARNGGAK